MGSTHDNTSHQSSWHLGPSGCDPRSQDNPLKRPHSESVPNSRNVPNNFSSQDKIGVSTLSMFPPPVVQPLPGIKTIPLGRTMANIRITTNNSTSSIPAAPTIPSLSSIPSVKERPINGISTIPQGVSLVSPTPERTMSPSSVIKIMEPLEKGAYGAVYTCKDNRDTRMAIKCIETDANGIPCLIETSIMSIFSHPYLNRAIRIQTTPKMLYIITDLAISDLSKWTRRDKGGHSPSPSQLRKWSHSLIQAVACLHRENIIHADIKASNVLLFSDGTIKLSDFTLATMRSTSERHHTVMTVTHRPLEIWLNREWDLEVDIWALGCTLYEIAYGELLFPYQGNTKEKDRENSQLREKTIACLLDWAERGPGGRQQTTISRPQVDYLPFQVSPLFSQDRYRLFNDLILSMLRLDPSDRPSAMKLLDHPYFKEGEPLSLVPYEMISTPMAKLPEKEVLNLTRQLNRFTNSSAIIRLSLELFSRCVGIRHENDHVKLMTCLWIASKLIQRTAITTDVPTAQILSMERLICAHLSFRLHVSSDPVSHV